MMKGFAASVCAGAAVACALLSIGDAIGGDWRWHYLEALLAGGNAVPATLYFAWFRRP